MQHVVELPALKPTLLRAGKTVLFSSLIPMGLFYAAFTTAGLKPALALTLAWFYGSLIVRKLRGQPLPATLLLGALLLTVRVAVSWWTGSAFLFFLQPVAGTIATAAALGMSATWQQPLLARLIPEFCPLTHAVLTLLQQGRFFVHASLVWAGMYVMNAAATVSLLLTSSTDKSMSLFLAAKMLLGPMLTTSAVIVSLLLLRRLARRAGAKLRLGPAADAAT